ncbi:hypothetical protein ACIOGX_25000 [Streptomyces sp. NPDC088147]|uniref:hypothetical protein n=1 Tax=unclassified Streptomyces TaxID=2593676 RepID=UPI0033A40A44
MRAFTRAALVAVCVVGAALAVVSAAQAAPNAAAHKCRYYYSSWGQGPNGEIEGFGDYAEGATDPQGRVCQNGWWADARENEKEGTRADGSGLMARR